MEQEALIAISFVVFGLLLALYFFMTKRFGQVRGIEHYRSKIDKLNEPEPEVETDEDEEEGGAWYDSTRRGNIFDVAVSLVIIGIMFGSGFYVLQSFQEELSNHNVTDNSTYQGYTYFESTMVDMSSWIPILTVLTIVGTILMLLTPLMTLTTTHEPPIRHNRDMRDEFTARDGKKRAKNVKRGKFCKGITHYKNKTRDIARRQLKGVDD